MQPMMDVRALAVAAIALATMTAVNAAVGPASDMPADDEASENRISAWDAAGVAHNKPRAMTGQRIPHP